MGIYYAKIEGLNTLRSGFINIYQNKLPVYELISGASITVGAFLLIIPGFISDVVGFLLLIPFTRKFLIYFILKKNKKNENLRDTGIKEDENIEEAEIIEDKNNEL